MASKNPNSGTSDTTEVVVIEAKPEATPEEKAQLRRWLDTIADEKRQHEDLWKQIAKNRKAAAGESDCEVHINLHQASLETLLPILYAQDPEVQVKPAQSVGEQRYAAVRAFAETLRIVIQRELTDANLKTTAERIIRAVKVAGFGVVKLTFQTDSEDDPLIVKRMQDVEDNLQRIATLTRDLAEGEGAYGDMDAQRADLEDTLTALQQKVEVLKSIGMVLDTVSPDDLMVPHDVAELLDYAQAPWLAQRAWLRMDEARSRYALSSDECGMLTTYAERDAANSANDGARKKGIGAKHAEKAELVVAWEIWDLRTNMFYTVLEGLATRYAKPPVAPQFTGRRFYPYFLLGMAWVDGQREPLSAVEMADPLVQEYNRTRSGYREHRENSIPATIFDSGSLSKEDVDRIKTRQRIENIPIDANGRPIRDVVDVLQYPGVDAALYDTGVIRGELDMLYGVQDAMRGVVMKSKTATEADIMQQGLASRTGGQRGALEAWLQEIAGYAAEVLLLAMPQQQALAIAGEGAQWPNLTRAQIQNDVVVEIRAGSTGRPDHQKDIQNWQEIAETLLTMLDKYVAALQAGQDGLAEAYKAIFAETLRRLDERLDPEQFLPKVEPQPPPPPPPQPLPETALQGQQIQALQGVVTAAQAGALLPERATALIRACFPQIPPELVAELVGTGGGVPNAGAPEGMPMPPGDAAPDLPAGPAVPAGVPPEALRSVLELAQTNPDVGQALHAAMASLQASGGTPPPPG